MIFENGNRVRLVNLNNFSYNERQIMEGRTGTVLDNKASSLYVKVELDEDPERPFPKVGSRVLMRENEIEPEFKEGDLYEDCGYVPRLLIEINEKEDFMRGISLVDGNFGDCSPHHCGPVKISVARALRLRADKLKRLS